MTILLRAMTLEDIDAEYIAWHTNEDDHLKFFSGSGRRFSAEVLQNAVRDAPDKNTHFFIIVAEGGNRIGSVRIGPIDAVNMTSDLVCLIGNRSYLGRGLAKEAIALANEIAFKDLGIRRLHGGMYRDNIASIKAYTGAGWYIEATMRGFYWVDGKSVDRICVACLNPAYFQDVPDEE